MQQITIDNIFYKDNTPFLIFKEAKSLSGRQGFTLPYITVSFSNDGLWCYATRFSKEGKSTNKTFRVPETVTDFLEEAKEIFGDVKIEYTNYNISN